MIKEWRHFTDVKQYEWPATFFTPKEIACKGTGRLKVDMNALVMLDKARALFGQPMGISSGYRSPEHNQAVGGAKNSRHLVGDAFDISTKNMSEYDKQVLHGCCLLAGFKGFGFAKTFLHVDTGSSRDWSYGNNANYKAYLPVILP